MRCLRSLLRGIAFAGAATPGFALAQTVHFVVPIWHLVPVLLVAIDPVEDVGSRVFTVSVASWNGILEETASRPVTVQTYVGNSAAVNDYGSRTITVQYIEPKFDVGSRPLSLDGTASLTVNVTFGDILAQNLAPQGVQVEIFNTWSPAIQMDSFAATLASGPVTWPSPTRQILNVRIKPGGTWLDTVMLADLRDGTAVVEMLLPNGDVDNSGEVDAVDIDEVIANFGAFAGPADLDASGEVDAVDIDITIANFGAVDE